MLSNEEIQAIITAIGTGIADEFDVAKLRYHRIIVMTDADVDGAHIRTLILTFLYRQMQELVERGHVYIAVAPLYRVKIGGQQRYVEKESQLEDLLVRERVKDMDVTDRAAATHKLTEARYGRFTRVLHEFDGWVSRLREDFGAPAATSSSTTGSSRPTRTRASRRRSPRSSRTGSSSPCSTRTRTATRVQIVERETGAAASVVVPAALLASPIYANVSKTYARLVEIVGQPPFRSRSGRSTRRADTFAQLREGALELAKEGIQVSRFKGLGEMNADELADTTHGPGQPHADPGRGRGRGCADRIFSTLMGDQVEPRRAFIEQNAQSDVEIPGCLSRPEIAAATGRCTARLEKNAF